MTRFLKRYEGQFLLLPEEEIPIREPSKPGTPAPTIHEGKKISRSDLIHQIIKVLQKHGGRARKDQVEQEVYQIFRDTFKEAWYQETVSHNIPRWKHTGIAWAKQEAKLRGLIKPPDESGRGYWELTESGMKKTL